MFEYSITPVAFSDHDAIFIIIKWGSRPRWGRGTWAMNTQVLEDPRFDLELKTLIEIYKANREILSNAESWDLFKKDIKKLAIEISTKRRKENDYEIKNLNKTFQEMRTHIDGGNSSVEDRILYEDTRQEIVMKNKEKEEGQRIRAKVEKIQFDEKSSKYFSTEKKLVQKQNKLIY